MNKNKSELIGTIIGDRNLWTDGRHYRVEITGDPNLDKEYFKHLERLIRKEFKENPSCRIRQKGIRLRICSKEFFIYLTRNLNLPWGSNKGLKVKIPDKIATSNWSVKSSCIRGIADTDGSLFFSKKGSRENYPTIEITTISRHLSEQLKELLEKENFRIGLISWNHQKENWNTRYVVSINGDFMIKKWIKKIGFSNPRHHKKINNIQI